MTVYSGKDCKVTIGSATVVGMGAWSITGITSEQIDSSAFGTTWKTFEWGMKDGGTVSFNGFADPGDTTGQEELIQAQIEATDLTTVRFYIDSTSYYTCNATTGYLSPSTTTGNDTPISVLNITSHDISADKGGLVAISFTGKASGPLVLI